MDENEGITRSRRRNMRRTAVTGSIFLLSFIFLLGALPLNAQADWTMDWEYGFGGSTDNGILPWGGLIRDGDGNLYGTTRDGGDTLNDGTIFKISADGNTYSVLHRFNSTDGASPYAGLIMDGDGNLYGTTSTGGAYNNGTVFKLDTSNNLTVLHSFNGTDGTSPYCSLIMDGDGNLYGTTNQGGAYNAGTVFMLDTGNNLTVLYSFKGGRDGRAPWGGLIMGGDGNLYGTTQSGGAYNYGTVFMLKTASKGKTYTVLHSFAGTFGRKGADGSNPLGSLIMDGSGNLYGTTYGGGTYSYGTVFMINSGSWRKTYTVLYSFNSTEGNTPYAGLMMDGDGNLYGTTHTGGTNSHGTVFMFDVYSNLHTLYNFSGSSPDGGYPNAGLIMDGSGNLYGTTSKGGSSFCSGGCGTVFKINPCTLLGSSCYALMTGDQGLTTSEEACQTRFPDGHLASIHSKDEDDFISNLVDPSAVGGITARIGGVGPFCEGSSGTYAWTDSTAWDYQNWRTSTGEPSCSAGETSIQFWPNTNGDLSGWNDVSSTGSLGYFVCKYPEP